MPDGHLPRSEDPRCGMCGCDRSVLLPDHRTRGKSTSWAHSTASGTGEPWHVVDGRPSSRGGGVVVATNHGQLAIFADGAPAPLLTSFAASKSFYRSVDVTKAHDMTLAGDASFNGGIFLAMAAVDRALKV
jgi:hypothetical protein